MKIDEMRDRIKCVDNFIDETQNTLKIAYNDLDDVNTHELSEVVDIYKDLAETKTLLLKSMYYILTMDKMTKEDSMNDSEPMMMDSMITM